VATSIPTRIYKGSKPHPTPPAPRAKLAHSNRKVKTETMGPSAQLVMNAGIPLTTKCALDLHRIKDAIKDGDHPMG
jgi:hypothetical protein